MIKTGIELRPWNVPNFAVVAVKPGKRQDGFKEAPTIPVADLDQEALDALANQWLDELYDKAEKLRPPGHG